MMRIPLSRGLCALVDDADFEWLTQWKWYAFDNRCGIFYAARGSRLSDGRLPSEPQRMIFMHRVLAGTPAGLITDHINGNGLDNRRTNLRCVTHAQNMLNRRKHQGSRSVHKGITFDPKRGKWLAAIQVEKKHYHIGRFSTEEQAADAYKARAAELLGHFNREPAA